MNMETEWGGLLYTRVGESFYSLVNANQAADDFEVFYNLSCVVKKVRTRWCVFARGPTYHEIVNVKQHDNPSALNMSEEKDKKEEKKNISPVEWGTRDEKLLGSEK